MKIGLIGEGAIGHYVTQNLLESGLDLCVRIVRPHKVDLTSGDDVLRIGSAADLPEDIDLMVDCAGHEALREHGTAILERGVELATISLGALADPALETRLTGAAQRGGVQLHLASGAIGALDCLRAAKVGGLDMVEYTGRKPPESWRGSLAEAQMDLRKLTKATSHFAGTARQAACDYPKNANVAAAVALAGTGFDNTTVNLIADPNVTTNIHEIHASGGFGKFSFRVEGKSLPDNPRSSALAAMSVIAAIQQRRAPVTT